MNRDVIVLDKLVVQILLRLFMVRIKRKSESKFDINRLPLPLKTLL